MFRHYLKELTIENVIASVRDYQKVEAESIMKYYNYYNGIHKILNRKVPEGRYCNNIVDNQIRAIVDSYLGFINPGGIETTDAFLLDNLTEIQDSIKDSLITGVGYGLAYYDDILTYKRLFPTNTMVFRDTTISHKVIGACFWNYYNVIEDGFSREYIDLYVYDETFCYYYSGRTLEGVALQDTWQHNLSNVPIIEFKATSHYDSVESPGIPLQDSLNMTLSSYTDGRESFSNPYLVITGIGIDDNTAQSLVDGDRKVINLPLPDASASYLLKQDSGSDIVSIISDLTARIYKACNVPDFGDNKYASASGAALISKTISFTNACNQYRKSYDESLEDLALITTNFTYEWPSYYGALLEANEAVQSANESNSDIADIQSQSE